MDLIGAPATATDGLSDSGFPRGNVICPACSVSWPPGVAECWMCGRPGVTSGLYAATLEELVRCTR